MTIISCRCAHAAAEAAFAAPAVSLARERPTRAITFTVPYAPGGSTDLMSRKFCEILETELKVKLIVENKRGESATIGTSAGCC